MSKALWISIPHWFAACIIGMATRHAYQHFELASPEWLWALLLLFVHWMFRLWNTQQTTQIGLQWSWQSKGSKTSLRQQLRQLSPELPFVCRTLAIGFLVIAAARPQSSSSVEDLTREGIDIILSMDLSASMLSKDFEPNRLEASKKVAAQFVEERPNDRIGVVAYEGESFTQIPLTTDQRVVMNGIKDLETGLLEGGTAIGMGLATAVNRLRDSEAKSKVIILLTDGVNNAGQIEPFDAAQLAQLNDIRVYTVGVGTIGKARSPVSKNGNRYQYDWVEVRIDEETLKRIASSTGGRYFRATNQSKLESIYEEIDSLEKTRFNVLRYNQRTEEFSLFALLGILALLLEFLFNHLFIRSIL
jgi:Ca-activated chloride channel family protein